MAEGRFQVATGAVILRNSDNKVLLIQRAKNVIESELWEYPAGRLQQFEDIEVGLRREVKEEVGLTNFEVLQPIRTFTYMRGGNEAKNEVKGIVFLCKTSDTSIDLSEEHDKYDWLSLDEAINRVTHEGIKQDLIIARDITHLTP